MDEPENTPKTKIWPPPANVLPPWDVPFRPADGQPERIGRYVVRRILGEGSFGIVYLAHDGDLNRAVAIKVPRPERVARSQDVEAYLTEARAVATLNHPHIVPVYDVGRTEDGLCYVVSRFIDGQDLASVVKVAHPPHARSAEIVATIAEALHHAHARGLVHRDVKPANLLIDAQGKPHVADFGMALKETEFGKGPGFAGTPAYMSPEQARGEGHRVDGRSDIFSLGVVFYELLTGRRPFRAETQQELLEQIASTDSRPPRQWDDTIPRELERICLKAMSRRVSERYTTAGDMAEDLHCFLKHAPAVPVAPVSTVTPSEPPSTQPSTPIPGSSAGSESDSRPIKIVPKGLKSFDEHDADAFLELLPGPRDRDGLPDSLRFWKLRLEGTDPDKTFSVGLIYGPSGCGKSSLVKAGLLPRLRKHVMAVYVEATPDETEVRLLKGLRKACPDLPSNLGLAETLAALRRGEVIPSGRKVAIVLDQFEQWLHARAGVESAALLTALRQCDGGRVQAVVMVRDDFWMAATRFLRDLDVRLLEGENSAAVDLFEPRHARKVLTAFGRAFGALPDRIGDLSHEQELFLDQAIAGLAEMGKIISVRLSLFAEMVKGKAWAPATLKQVGGIEGVGVTFLEETFSASTAPPGHRLHQKAARAVLKTLLPESGTDIKGHMRSHEELLEASGYAARPGEFGDLLRILDGEVRLITPTDPDGLDGEEGKRPEGRYYQLTHDYLVPSLRDWLTRKQRETRRGRAELRLADRAALWSAKPEDRHLPSVAEWTNIRLLTKTKDWNAPQRKMMKKAGRFHGLRAFGLAVLLALLTWGGIEGYGSLRASAIVESIAAAETSDVPRLVPQLTSYRRWANPRLRQLARDSKDDPKKRLHASLALLPVDPGQVDYLYDRLLAADPTVLPVIRDSLKAHRAKLSDRLWAVLEDTKSDPDQRFRAACALAGPDEVEVSPRWDAVSAFLAERLVALVLKNPSHYAPLLEMLRPVSGSLLASLSATFRDATKPESERSLATNVLADYAADRPDVLADLLLDAEEKPFAVLFETLKRHQDRAVPLLETELAKQAAPEAKADDRDKLDQRKGRAAIALVRLGQADEVWKRLRHSKDPSVRSYIVNWLKPLGGEPQALATRLSGMGKTVAATPDGDQSVMNAVLFHPETSERRALILALGQYEDKTLLPAERERLVAQLLDLYRTDPDAGIHGAAEWTLRRWGREKALVDADIGLPGFKERGDRRWYRNSQGQTLALIEGPVGFSMGSPESEPGRSDSETLHPERITWRFAIATKEVAVEQYQQFAKENPAHGFNYPKELSPSPQGPQIGPSWFDAAAYCNWLSRQEGLDKKSQWCYEPNSEGEYAEGMKLVADVLERTGYRLPTEAEWEFVCRAGAETSRYYGGSAKLLKLYAQYIDNSQQRAWPCGQLQPNDLGLFDMLGNVYEWCLDRYDSDLAGETNNMNKSLFINEKNPRLLRGGAFNIQPALVRSAFRSGFLPSNRISDNGFRLARTYP